MDKFEKASRLSLAFPSAKGLLCTDQLWTVPLTSTDGFSLDAMARAINKELKAITEESFVETKQDAHTETMELQLEILKHIISVKVEEKDSAAKAKERKAKRDRLIEILGQKQDEELKLMGRAEIEKLISDLE